MRRLGPVPVLLGCILSLAPLAHAQSVWDIAPHLQSPAFVGNVTMPDGSVWTQTGLQLAPGRTLTFPDFSSWNATGPVLSATSSVRFPDTSIWGNSGLTMGTGKRIALADGNPLAPALSFATQPGLGFYRAGADDLRCVYSTGTECFKVTNPAGVPTFTLGGVLQFTDVSLKRTGTDAIGVKAGGSASDYVRLGGVLCSSATAAATTGTSSQTLATCTVPASALSVDAKGLKVKAWGTTAANANDKTLEVHFGATLCGAITAAPNNGSLMVESTILRAGATAQVCQGLGASSTAAVTHTAAAPAETLSGAVTVAVKATTPTASGDFTFRGLTVELFN